MHVTAILVAAFGAAAVNAVIGDIGVPKTIKPGDKFNILGHQTIGQGYGEYAIIFGIQNVDPAVGLPSPDSLGGVFAGPYDLALFSGYNLTIPNVSASGNPGPALVRVAVLGLAGVYKSMSLSTFSINTTIGTSTSTEYVYTDIYHRGPSCTWQS